MGRGRDAHTGALAARSPGKCAPQRGTSAPEASPCRQQMCAQLSQTEHTHTHTHRPAALTQHSAHSGPHDSKRKDLAGQMFNHVPSRKLFFIKRGYNRFHLTSKTFSIVQRCPLRSTGGTQLSGFKLQIRPLPKGGRSVQ